MFQIVINLLTVKLKVLKSFSHFSNIGCQPIYKMNILGTYNSSCSMFNFKNKLPLMMFAKFRAVFLFSFLFSTLPQTKAPMGEAMLTTKKLLCETIKALPADNLIATEFLPNTN